MCYVLCAMYYMLYAICYMLYAICYMLSANLGNFGNVMSLSACPALNCWTGGQISTFCTVNRFDVMLELQYSQDTSMRDGFIINSLGAKTANTVAKPWFGSICIKMRIETTFVLIFWLSWDILCQLYPILQCIWICLKKA